MLGEENLLIYMTQIIKYIQCIAFGWGKICCQKSPKIVCSSVLYSRPLILDSNPGSLLQGKFLWRVLWMHFFVFFNGGHFVHLPSASSLNFTHRKSSFMGPKPLQQRQRIKTSSCYIKTCKTHKILEKPTQMEAGMMEMEMKTTSWIRTGDRNTQGGGRKVMEVWSKQAQRVK